MKRGALWLLAVVLLGACNGGGGGATGPTSTIPSTGALDAALLTQSQLRRVPGLSTATVSGLPTVDVFDDPDPRGACGGSVPRLGLADAIGTAWKATTIRSGAQVVLRRPAKELQQYLAARIKDARADCPVFEIKNRAGATQEMKFERAVSVTRNADQSLAIVLAVRVNGAVRAVTTIEVRTNNVLSRVVIFTNRPMPVPTVRGVASLIAKSLEAVS